MHCMYKLFGYINIVEHLASDHHPANPHNQTFNILTNIKKHSQSKSSQLTLFLTNSFTPSLLSSVNKYCICTKNTNIPKIHTIQTKSICVIENSVLSMLLYSKPQASSCNLSYKENAQCVFVGFYFRYYRFDMFPVASFIQVPVSQDHLPLIYSSIRKGIENGSVLKHDVSDAVLKHS